MARTKLLDLICRCSCLALDQTGGEAELTVLKLERMLIALYYHSCPSCHLARSRCPRRRDGCGLGGCPTGVLDRAGKRRDDGRTS